MKINKTMVALAVSLSMFSSVSFAATSTTTSAKSSLPPEHYLASNKQMYVEIESLKGTEDDGANMGIMAFENKGGTVGVGLSDAENPNASSSTSVEAVPFMLPDGKVSVEIKIVKSRKSVFEGCTIAESGKRVVIDGNGVSLAVTAYNYTDTQAIKNVMDAARSGGNDEACGEGEDCICAESGADSAFGSGTGNA